jgi:5'-nucleotidase
LQHLVKVVHKVKSKSVRRRKLKIFITNDDGINANGIKELVDILAKDHEIYVVAPEFQQSAMSHALTLNDILFSKKSNAFTNVKEQWTVDGTPADCVKIGMDKFKDVEFDLVLSGINEGPNVGMDVVYSGTVAAALEGSFFGIPSIAFSDFSLKREGLKRAAEFIGNNLEQIVKNYEWNKDMLNINFPDVSEYKGVKNAKLGEINYLNPVERRVSPRGSEYYWIAGDIHIPENQVDADIHLINEGYVTITPLKFIFEYETIKKIDLTDITT